MTTPSVVLCTLCLNEMEWLPRLYEQHRNWPGLRAWIFVEAADRQYAEANQNFVNDNGLSVDGTTQFLSNLALKDSRVIRVGYGFCGDKNNPAQGKCEARTQYLKLADEFRPDFLFVLDADEFYSNRAQSLVMKCMNDSIDRWSAYCFKQRHLWRPRSIKEHCLTELEVVGGFWDIPHTRGYRWSPGLVYRRNHNTPQSPDGKMADLALRRFDQYPNSPYCIHTGFASHHENREAKNRYYAMRGESIDPKRQWYVKSRAEFERWSPGSKLPNGAKVVYYQGEIPECFQPREDV